MLEPLIRELSSDSVGLLALEAAEAIGDPCLYPTLVSLKSWWATDGKDAELLEAALAKCSPEQTSLIWPLRPTICAYCPGARYETLFFMAVSFRQGCMT
jgi:hypothetical protein